MSSTAWRVERERFEEIYEGSIEPGKEPKKLFRQAYEGTIVALSYAEILLNKAIKDFGPDHPVGYGKDTAYFLPAIRALSGEEVTKLGDLVPILNRMRDQVHPEISLENGLLWGEATIYAAEIIEAVRYATGRHEFLPKPWTGFIPDPLVRKWGIKHVDWTIPGEVLIVGRFRTSEDAIRIVNKLVQKSFMIFLCDEVIEQLLEQGFKFDVEAWPVYPLGNFTQVIHAVNYSLRASSMFPGIPPGDRFMHRNYLRDRILVFVMALGERDIVKVAASFAAIFLGFPVIVDQPLEEDEIWPEWYFSIQDYDEMVQVGIEVRGIKITAIEIDIPVAHGPAFEGEAIRKADMYCEFGGGRSMAFELVKMASADEVQDGRFQLIGPDLDQLEPGKAHPLGIVIEVYGRKFQEDFEPVLERRIHYFCNYGEGVWHTAQRDLMWFRISKAAFEKGFRFEHLAKLLYGYFKKEYAAIIDRLQVTIITDPAEVEKRIEEAREKYRARDARLEGLRDEAVEEFYTCTLCQSFAPTHICFVSPERTGLCGAVSWLDAKATYEIDPTGVCQPVKVTKEYLIDPVKGEWSTINEEAAKRTQGKTTSVCMYTAMDRPMTTCGCCECIAAYSPELNGFVITAREYNEMTPVGMTFSTLAGMVGGGQQTPGFVGLGKLYLISRKFLPADGGIGRIVWMPKFLKEELREGLNARGKEAGYGDNFADMIADETVGVTPDEVLPFLQEKGHPALSMEPLM
ncbi:MAG: Carbon monoxide dehydrogenase/acetyl-CoA synthase subunit alpha [Thermoanaerobacterales bacterium 50_218]|nr:MAG: Carbon monoxide dehydrogenase/acetyl-CoA synthase subunit alpha [Thermoanaerobacterales bacterium 50_218]HAA90307.1 CO dehydrogenase/CO-methylating acetyl-CoA synthase complex subunit beta [Peptococcaceae bacterium]